MSEKLTRRPSRQWLLLVSMVGLAVAVALSMAFAGEAQAKKKHHHHRGAAAAPVVPDASCQGTASVAHTYTGEGRFAQTFTAEHSGVLTAAQAQQILKPSSPSKGDWILQIGTVDQSTGVPHSSNNVIASAIVPDSTVPEGVTTLTGTFADPPSVVKDQKYALILIRPGSTIFQWGDSLTNSCGGSGFFSTTQTGAFTDFGNDFFFATFVTV